MHGVEATDPGSVVLEPDGKPVASVIWLHGLGADGNDFVPLVPDLQLPPRLAVRFVFPHAPVRPVTLNGGMQMRAWFDIARLDFEGDWDSRGVARSVERLDGLVAREMADGVPRTRIIIAGFSQGGAVALEYLLRHGAGLAGVVALSTFHPAGVRGAGRAGAGAPPLFGAHGRYDPVVPYALGERTLSAFARAGYAVSWHEYRMAHQVCPEEIWELSHWLFARLEG